MGNAVCPMVASALGRCLVLAAAGAAPSNVEQAVVSVPDPDYVQVSRHASTQSGTDYASALAVHSKKTLASY